MASKKKKKISGFQIPESLRSPLREQAEAVLSSDAEHAFFLRCFELYRTIDLSHRTLVSMIEAYSKYRTRDLFTETFSFRFFDLGPESFTGIEPGLNTTVIAMFNLIHELRISLLHEDALPFTVKARIETALAELKREWNSLTSALESQFGWKFKTFPLSEAELA
jgi:hypothetical protein